MQCGTAVLAAVGLLFQEGGWVEVFALDVLEVAICANFQLHCGVFVANEDCLAVHLQRAECTHLRNAAFYCCLQCASLLIAVDDNHHALCCHDCAYTHGEGCLRHFVYVVVEEAAVGYDCVLCECLLASERSERTAWLIESDVAVGTNATHEKVDAASFGDASLIVGTLLFKVGSVAVENVDILFLDVDVAKEIVPHEAVIAFGVAFGQVAVFVHVECDNIFKRHFAGLVELDEFFIHAKRRASGWATQHERLLGGWLGCIDA